MTFEDFALSDWEDTFEVDANTEFDYSAEKQFLQKFDRILSENMAINVEKTDRASAFADMKLKTINLNFKECFNLNSKDYSNFIKSLKGLNHHELAHLLWTAKPRGYLYDFDKPAKKELFNILEDTRIENLFTTKYPITEPYFCWNVILYIQKNGEKANGQSVTFLRNLTIYYMLVYGRKFFDRQYVANLRNQLSNTINLFPDYKYDLKLLEFCQDEFIVTHNFQKQKVIIDKVYQILEKILNSPNTHAYQNDLFNIQGHRDFATGGNPKREKEAEKMNEELQEKSDSFSKEIKKESKKEKSDSSIPTSDEMDRIIGREKLKDKLMEETQKIQQKVSESVEAEVQKDIQEINSIKSVGKGNMEAVSEPLQISNEDRIVSTKLKNLIRRLRTDLGQHYVRKQKAGMVIMRDYIQTINKPIPDLKVFRKFKHSKLNKTKLGVIILLDSSGSMTNQEYKLALRSAYCVSNSLETTDSKVEVIAFSHGNYDVIKPFRKSCNSIKWERRLSGGTNPVPSMMFSDNELNKIRKEENIENLMFILISDCFFPTEEKANSLETIRNLGKKYVITTFQVGLSAKWSLDRKPIVGQSIQMQVKELSDYFYSIISFDELYNKMADFIKKFETQLHINILRGSR